jgi:4-hydroxy-tetrahydrodipicolinate synthase
MRKASLIAIIIPHRITPHQSRSNHRRFTAILSVWPRRDADDATCDLSRFSVHSLSSAPNFIRWSGDDSASLLFRMAGGTCSVSIVANVVPRLWADMQRACEGGDWSGAKSIQTRLKPLMAALQLETNPAPVKYALSLAHPWFSPTTRLPLAPVSQQTARAIDSALKELEVVD